MFYIVQNSQLEGQPFEPPTSAQLAGSASVLVRVCPTTPTRCNSVAFRFKDPRIRVKLGTPGPNFVFYIVQNSKLEGQPFEPPTSAQLAGSASVLVRVCPTTPTRCNPVAFGFKTRESVSNLGPQGQISCFISYRTHSWRVSRSSPRPRPN